MKPVAVIFDLFGTLLDIASLRTAAARYAAEPGALVATWREKQIAYAFAATIMQRYEDFDALTERALRYAAARHNVHLDAFDAAALAAAWRTVEPYADARATLEHLRGAGIRCAILTNGTFVTAAAAVEHAGLTAAIDVTLSVETVRIYKPSPRVYALASEHYRTSPDRLTFVSANGWDATGAAECGFQVVWCNRAGVPAETFGAPAALTVRDLHEFVASVDSGAV